MAKKKKLKKCQYCAAAIRFIKSKDGNLIPVSPLMKFVRIDPGGKWFITREGSWVRAVEVEDGLGVFQKHACAGYLNSKKGR